jgi:hypothetical protein
LYIDPVKFEESYSDNLRTGEIKTWWNLEKRNHIIRAGVKGMGATGTIALGPPQNRNKIHGFY